MLNLNIEKVDEIIKKAGEMLLCLKKNNDVVKINGIGQDLVTNADLLCESFLIQEISKIIPEAQFISEEQSKIRSESYSKEISEIVWIIDPIDGTKNFLEGMVEYGIQVALVYNNEVVAAWLHAPEIGKTAYAVKGEGVVCQGFKRSDIVQKNISEMNITFASGDFPNEWKKCINGQIKKANNIYGTKSCVVDYLNILSGNRDLLIYRRTLPWDHLPGAFLVQASGGTAKRFNGETYRFNNKSEGLIVSPCSYNLLKIDF